MGVQGFFWFPEPVLRATRPYHAAPVTGLALPFVTAAVTDKLVDFATNVIGDLGYAGIFVLMTLESALIPIPSEATMLFAGFKVDDGTLTLFGIVAAGVLGNLVGSWIAYAIGYYGRLELVERHRIFHANRRYLDWADDWFNRHGDATVFFSRMVPVDQDLHLAPGRCRENAVLALHLADAPRLHSLGLRARLPRQGGREQVG